VVVSGVILDQTGAAIAGAEVILSAAKTPSITTKTDQQGVFAFKNVKHGTYNLGVRYEKFSLYKTALQIGAQPVSPLQITLDLDQLRQRVEVVAEAPQVSTDTSQNRDALTVTTKSLSALPVFDQDYVTTLSRFLDPGATATGGVTLVVDGAEANGPGVSPSAIQSVKINQDPYSAQFSRPGRGRLEIETKPASPDFHGEFNFLFRDYHLDARDPFALQRAPEQKRTFEGFLTGPLGKGKKTSFLLTGSRSDDNLQAALFAQGPNGTIRENIPTPQDNLFTSARVSRQYGVSNVFWAGFSVEDDISRNKGVGGTVLPEAGTGTRFREYEFTSSDTRALSPRLLNQFRFLAGHFRASVTSNVDAPQMIVNGAFTSGGAQADYLRTEYHVEFHDMLSWTHGKQFWKFGVDVPDISRRAIDDNTNRLGTYSFASLADYGAGTPYALVLQRGNGRVTFLEKTVAGFAEDQIQLRSNLSVTLGLRYYWQNFFHDVPHDFAPRLAFAWSPGSRKKTVIRGGSGFFYDRTGPTPIADVLRFDGHHLNRYVLTDPAYPFFSLNPSLLNQQPLSLVQLDPGQIIPYLIQYSASVEHQLAPSLTVSVGYTGYTGVHLFRSRDVNAPLPPSFGSRPDPAWGQIRQIESAGRSLSNALDFNLRGNITKRFSGQVQYTLSRTENNTAGVTWFPANSFDPSGEWGLADTNQTHRLNVVGNLEKGKWLKFGLLFAAYSGKPYNETTGQDENQDGLAYDRLSGVGRNTLTGDPYLSLDLRWSHDFFLTARGEKGPILNTGVDAFNLTNHVNYLTYVGALTSPFFGQPVSAYSARRLQFGLRFTF